MGNGMQVSFRLTDTDDGGVRVDYRDPLAGGLSDGWSHMGTFPSVKSAATAIADEVQVQIVRERNEIR